MTTTQDSNRAGYGAAAAVVLCVALLMLYRGFAGDDTYIHLQYARNIAAGHGFVFNLGEPSYGSTSPLWTLLVAQFGRLAGGQFYLAAKVLSVVFTALSVLLFHRLVRRVLTSTALVTTATFAFVLDPWLLKWGGSGMETSLGILCVLGATLLHLRERERGGMPWSALVLGGGTLARPELLGLFLVTLFDRVVFARRPARESVVAVVLFLLPLAPWVLYSVATFGDPIATTIHAKSGHTSFTTGIARTVKILGATYAPALLAILAGGVVAARRYRGAAAWVWIKRNAVIWGWAAGLPLAYVITESYIASRYLLLATPFLILLGFAAVSALRPLRGRTSGGILLLVLLAVVSAGIQATVVYPRTRFTRGVDENLIGVGEWIRDHTPPDALVAVHEVGAIGYTSERRVLDTAGLVTHRALSYVLDYRVADLLQYERADYYVSSGYWPTDRQVLDPLGGIMTKLYEVEVQRGGSSSLFAKPLKVGVYRFDWPDNRAP